MCAYVCENQNVRSFLGGKSLFIYDGDSTRHFERNFSFSIHILFDNWVRNSLFPGSFRTSEGTKPRASSTLTSSLCTAVGCWLSWLIVEDEKCCLNPRKELVCFPTFCLKTLKDSVLFPVLLVTTAMVIVRRCFSFLKRGYFWCFSQVFFTCRPSFPQKLLPCTVRSQAKQDVHKFVVILAFVGIH